MNRSDTDVEFDILFIASAIRGAIDNTWILLTFFILLLLSIVSVIINFFILAFLILFTASPLRTACVTKTWTSLAPFFIKASTAFTIVPPLSIIDFSDVLREGYLIKLDDMTINKTNYKINKEALVENRVEKN